MSRIRGQFGITVSSEELGDFAGIFLAIAYIIWGGMLALVANQLFDLGLG